MTDTKNYEGISSEQDFTDTLTGEEKTFTQSQLEEIISERLSRERRANASLGEVKKLLRSAKEGGLIKGGSYAEMAKQLIDAVTAGRDGAEDSAEEMQSAESCEEDTDFADASSVADEDAQTEQEKTAAADGGVDAGAEVSDAELFVTALTFIKQKLGEKEAERVFSGNLFENFAKGRRGSLDEIVTDFCTFMANVYGTDAAENNEVEEAQRDTPPDFTSTAFSAFSGAPACDMGLTKQQMEMAKSAGMSYREYAGMLESVPSKTRR